MNIAKIKQLRMMFPTSERFRSYYVQCSGEDAFMTMEGDTLVAGRLQSRIPGLHPHTVADYRKELGLAKWHYKRNGKKHSEPSIEFQPEPAPKIATAMRSDTPERGVNARLDSIERMLADIYDYLTK